MLTNETPDAWPGELSGVWRRLLAFTIDIFLLAIAGVVIEYCFFEFFAAIEEWGIIIGFVIAVAYFGLMNSRIFGGQTVGKMAMRIGVVARDGTFLKPSTSIVRSVICCLPHFLQGVYASNSTFTSVLLSVLGGGVMISNIYLLIFNRQTRQLVHDLVVGSIVIRAYAWSFPGVVGKVHLAIVTAILAVAAAIPIVTKISETTVSGTTVSEMFPMAELTSAVSSETGSKHVKVTVATNNVSMNDGNVDMASKTTLTITMTLKSKVVDKDELVNRVAQIAKDHYPKNVMEPDLIEINLVHGSDIGIISAWYTEKYLNHHRVEYRKELFVTVFQIASSTFRMGKFTELAHK